MKLLQLSAAVSLLLAIGVVAAGVSLAPDPHSAMAGAQPTPTPTATPCPTGKDPIVEHGGCGTPTATPSSQHPEPCPATAASTGETRLSVRTPCMVTMTPTPTATPCPTAKVPDTYHGSGCGTPTPTPTSNRPAPIPLVDKTVNGVDGPITVVVGDTVTYRWVVTAGPGSRPFSAVVDDDTFDVLDGSCPGFVPSCEKSATVVLLTPGPVTNTVRVTAVGIPPGVTSGYAQDSVTVFVVAPTPRPRALGDFNCDGSVNAIDAALILQISAGLAVPLPCTGDGDVNHDGLLNPIDAFLMLEYHAGLITVFP